jgi:hypothetical protein
MKSFKDKEKEREYNELIRERNILLHECCQSADKQKGFDRYSPAYFSLDEKIAHHHHRLEAILKELKQLSIDLK